MSTMVEYVVIMGMCASGFIKLHPTEVLFILHVSQSHVEDEQNFQKLIPVVFFIGQKGGISANLNPGLFH